MKKAAPLVLVLLLGAAGLLLMILALRRAALPYENGRYYDAAAGVTYTDSAPLAYGLLAFAFILAALLCAVWAMMSRQK